MSLHASQRAILRISTSQPRQRGLLGKLSTSSIASIRTGWQCDDLANILMFYRKTSARRLRDVDTSRKIPRKTRIWKRIMIICYIFLLIRVFQGDVQEVTLSSTRLPGVFLENMRVLTMRTMWPQSGCTHCSSSMTRVPKRHSGRPHPR